MTKALALSQVKARFPSIIKGIQKREEEVIVTKNGQPAAVILSYLEFVSMQETLDVLSDSRLMRQIQKSRDFFRKKKKALSFDDVFGEPLVPFKRGKKHSA